MKRSSVELEQKKLRITFSQKQDENDLSKTDANDVDDIHII